MDETLNPGIEATGGQVETGTTQEMPAEGTSTPTESEKFTKDQVNDMMKRRVERSHRAFFNRYGVNNLDELDELFGKAGSYDDEVAANQEWNQKYADLEKQHKDLQDLHKDLTKRYGYKACNIDSDKIADIETYFKGKGLDISEETLIEELKTHPDWVKKVATIQQLGAEATTQPDKDGKAEAERIFGVKLR